jgi:O-glycosyl hydrolase
MARVRVCLAITCALLGSAVVTALKVGYSRMSLGFATPGDTSSVTATTYSADVNALYASRSPHDIVVINESATATQNAVIQTTGVTTGSVQAWRIDQTGPVAAAPTELSDHWMTTGEFGYSLPPMSVTTFVVTPAVSSPSAS